MTRLDAVTGDFDQVQSLRHVSHSARYDRRVFVPLHFEPFKCNLCTEFKKTKFQKNKSTPIGA